MDPQGAIGLQDLKKDRSHAQQGAPPVQAAGDMTSIAHVNGPTNGANGALPNGVPSFDGAHTVSNGASNAVAGPASMENPPALDQSWREGPTNKSLGLLMQRLASQCVFDLQEMLDKMKNEVPNEPQHQQPNGVMAHTGQDTSESSIIKKRMLLEFAGNQRERFIKTMILNGWSRNPEDMSRLLDVKVWQDKNMIAHHHSLQAILNTKNNMIGAKMPNPNIEGAMEVLATGKASWIPDMGFIPPKRLTAKQLLKTLRDMNLILATRLNLHEELPPHFTDFSIADGRATFRVQDEFEVDLSVAAEDPKTPFYFIDIRLSFNPAAEVINDGLRGVMERKVNEELATRGLKGCYDWIHSFCLMHKLNVLRGQATAMVRGKWFDCVRIEAFRRRLVVHYWAGIPGPKSWVEIGVHSGKRSGYHPSPPTPRLAVRWFRKGVEVKDETLEFDWRDLDLEKSLYLVIAAHTAWIMNDVKSRIQNLAPHGSSFKASVSKLHSESDLGVLILEFPSLRRPLQIHIEPITGQFAISPPSQATGRCEHRLNSDTAIDAAKHLATLPCAAVQERVGKEAALIGWSPSQHSTPVDQLPKFFNEPVRYLSVFRPSLAWGESWALAVTFSLAGEKWWAVSLKDQRDNDGKITCKAIASASRVLLPNAANDMPAVSREMLLAVERAAVAHVGLATTGKQLKDMQISHVLQKLSSPDGHHRQTITCNMALFVNFPALTRKSPQSKSKKPWADEVIRLTHHGIAPSAQSSSDSAGGVRHDLRLSLDKGKMAELSRHVSRSNERDLVVNSDGGLALKFLTHFGEPFVKQMQERLQSVERLESYLATLKERNFKCTHVSLTRLDFTYNSTPEYTASLNFATDDSRRIRLRLSPPADNPHQRIRVLLENGLNGTEKGGFAALTRILAVTLPVLETFDQLEAKSPSKQSISVHPRTSTWFTVKYDSPLPSVVFQVKGMIKTEGQNKKFRWLIQDVKSSAKDSSLAEDLCKALDELWQESGEHWQGMRNCIVAEAQGMAVPLERLDEVIRRFQGSADSSSAKATDAVKDEEGAKPSTTEQSRANPAGNTAKSQTTADGRSAGSTSIKTEPDVVVLD
jgi:mediator of RNA polymerase II transcription subunit 14